MPAYAPDPPKTARPAATTGFVVTSESAGQGGTLLVAEGGTARLRVKLGEMPDRPQLVTVRTSKPQALTASPQYVVFDTSTFDVPQDVTLTGVQDEDTADEDVKVVLSAPEVSQASIDVRVRDDDVQALLLSESLLSVAEGKTGVIDVQPKFAPSWTMTITVVSRNPAAALPSPTTLTFAAQDSRLRSA
jgi:hypothetical protein